MHYQVYKLTVTNTFSSYIPLVDLEPPPIYIRKHIHTHARGVDVHIRAYVRTP